MRRIIKLISLALACFSISFLITSYSSQKDDTKYILSEYNGKLAVFYDDSKFPKDIYNIYVSSFPQEEQNKLISGINVDDEYELQEILESYLS